MVFPCFFVHMPAITAMMLCQLLLRAAGTVVRRRAGAEPEETVFMAVIGTDGWKNTAVHGDGAAVLRVGLQGAALGTGQMIRQPVEDGTQRQAGQNILTPVGPAGTGPYKALHGNNGTGAGVLRDAALIIDTGALAKLGGDALGAGQIQPVFPAVGAEIGLVDQAVGAGREAAHQLAIGVVAQLPALAEQLEVQAAATHGGVAQNGGALTGQLLQLQAGIVAAGVLQLYR